jgi:hypothetical protein
VADIVGDFLLFYRMELNVPDPARAIGFSNQPRGTKI